MQRTIILAVLSSVFGVGLGYLLGRVPEPVQDARVSDAVVAEQMRPQGGLATDTVARPDVDGSAGLKDNSTRIDKPSALFPAEPLSPPPLDDPMADLTSPTGAPLSFGPDLDADYPFAQMPDLGMEEAVEFGPVLDVDNPLDGSIAAGEESIAGRKANTCPVSGASSRLPGRSSAP